MRGPVRSSSRAVLLAIVLSLPASSAHAQSNLGPSDVVSRRATVSSEGIALAAEVHQLKSTAGQPRPTIVLCHGWGGEMAGLKRQAAAFAAAGYTAITFDYRGWGESGGRLVLSKPQAPRRDGRPFAAEVVELREVVHPWEHVQDIVSGFTSGCRGRSLTSFCRPSRTTTCTAAPSTRRPGPRSSGTTSI